MNREILANGCIAIWFLLGILLTFVSSIRYLIYDGRASVVFIFLIIGIIVPTIISLIRAETKK